VLIAQADTVWGHLEDYLDLTVAVFAQAARAAVAKRQQS